MSTVSVVFQNVSVIRVQKGSVASIRVNTKSPTVIAIKGSGVSDNSVYSMYGQWLTVDGGNPFSVFRDEDVLDGGKPSDF